MNKTILVIEDDEQMVRLYQTALSRFGEVRVANSLAQARTQLQGLDLIVLDYHLEDETIRFQDMVPELKQHAPVLLCSGVFDPRVPAMGQGLGVVGYWNKVDSLDALFQLVAKALGVPAPSASGTS